MRQRPAIAVSGVAAAFVLAVGLSAAGFGPVSRSEANGAAGGSTPATTISDLGPEPEVVYVEPAPEPETVVVTRRATDGAEAARTRSSRAIRVADHDDDEEEAEDRAEREHDRVRRTDTRRERDDDHEERERDDD